MGLGEIIELQSIDKVLVRFTGAGKRLLKGVPLVRVTGAEAQGPLVFPRSKQSVPRSPRNRRTIEEYRAAFLDQFPKGFRGADFVERERRYKMEASETLNATLGKRPFQRLMRAADYEEVCRLSLAVVNKTNLIFKNEKMALRDGLATTTTKRRFAVALFDLLHGPADFEQRFTRFANLLVDLDAAKWTVATYFPFLAEPSDHIFVKPSFTRRLADACDVQLNYRPEPNWLTYRCILDLANTLSELLRDLKPRDMVDIQSFIWCVAKDAKAE